MASSSANMLSGHRPSFFDSWSRAIVSDSFSLRISVSARMKAIMAMKSSAWFAVVLASIVAVDSAGAVDSAEAGEPVQVVFDTDIAGDVDDVLALGMLHALADRGECRIEAVTISKINPLAAPFVDAVNTFYGRPDIPIGATRDAQVRESKYLSLCKQRGENGLRFPHDVVDSQDVPDAVSVLRRTLASAADRSIVLIQVGLAANLADLIESPSDEISPLSGRELVKRKVRLTSVMAGAFRPVHGDAHYLEANVRNGIASMQRFASQWPDECPVVWSDFLIGIQVAVSSHQHRQGLCVSGASHCSGGLLASQWPGS